ncbi:hypothetical protein ANCCAN_15495 [Ancylostoma caninum]|uniref:Uncharacterized protein n=1 Tax=Ancylostoma caninum TaxID=29170 RepID=A0A368G7E0_ANCCA|nr:hypothetical protein ANCCAN_15495 [Ancylostoma caninum]
MFTYSQHFKHCANSQDNFREVVEEYRPNVLFILARYTREDEGYITLQAEGIVKETTNSLLELSRNVKDQVFVLNVIPRPISDFSSIHANAIQGHKTEEPVN